MSKGATSMRMLKKILCFVEEDLPAYLLGVIAVLILCDVFGRYVLNSPIRAASEISFILIVWVVYLTTAALVRRGMHIAVDSLYELLPAPLRFVLDLCGELVLIVVVGYVTVHTIDFVVNGHFITLPATGLSKQVITLAIAVGLSLSVLHAVSRIVGSVFLFRQSAAEYHRLYDPYEIETFEDLDTRGVKAIQQDFEDEVMS